MPIYGRIAVMRLLRPPVSKSKRKCRETRRDHHSFAHMLSHTNPLPSHLHVCTQSEPTDLLFLATERHTFCLLAYDPASGELVTRANGDIADRVGRPADTGTLGGVDPACRAVGLHLYDGLFKVIPVDPRSGSLSEAFNVRVEELGIVGVAFLEGGARPTVAFLHDAPGGGGGGGGGRAVVTYEIALKDKDFLAGPWSLPAVDPGASLLAPLPAPLGGCLVLGGAAITYAGGAGGTAPPVTLATAPLAVRAVARVDDDGSRWLVGDAGGSLSLLALSHAGGVVSGLRLERLGPIPAPSALAYLDNGVVYVGSAWADGQLVRLCAEPVAAAGGGGGGPEESFLQVLDTFPNVGPIVDMAVLDGVGSASAGGNKAAGGGAGGEDDPTGAPSPFGGGGGGACQLVTASGVAQDGSLRIIRNGVGVAEVAAVDLPGITRLWGLRGGAGDTHDSLLLLSFVSSTLLLGLDEDGALGEAEAVGDLEVELATLAAAAGADGVLLQATPRGVRALAPGTRAKVGEWTPPAGASIASAAANGAQVLVATSDGNLTLLARDPATGALAIAGGPAPAPYEVACLDITPLGWPEPAAADGAGSGLALVGGWDVALRVLALPSLAPLLAAPLPLGGDAIPRSTLALRMEGVDYALVSLGDGRLAAFRLTVAGGGVGPGQVSGVGLGDRRVVALGRRPAVLAPFVAGGKACALAAGDRPAVAHSANRKLLFSNVNEGDATAMARFNAAAFPDAVAVARAPAGGGGGGGGAGGAGPAGPPSTDATGGRLAIGTVDAVQRLHVRCVPLGEQPRRIAHQPETRTLAVTVDGGGGGGGGAPTAAAAATPPPDAVRLFDDSGFAPLDRLALDPAEVACSLTSLTFAGDPTPYYALGTAVTLPDEAEPSKGRILVLAAVPCEEGASPASSASAGRRLEIVAARDVRGAVYALVPFRGGLLAGGNSRVSLYTWAVPGGGGEEVGGEGEDGEPAAAGGGGTGDAGDAALGPHPTSGGGGGGSAPTPAPPLRAAGGPPARALAHVTSHSGHVLALYLATNGDFVGVGDLMRSIQVLAYNPATRTLEPRARDYHSNWMTAISALGPGDDAFLGAENSYNLFSVVRNASAAADEDRARLDVAAEWHLGDFVNRFVPGSLVMRPPDGAGGGEGGGGGDALTSAPLIAGPTLLFGTIGGAVGVVAPLSAARFAWFDRLQACMRRAVRGVGGLDHAGWRAFANERGAAPGRGVVDGDLVEQFLELPATVATDVAADFGRGETAESIAKVVDDLSRACH